MPQVFRPAAQSPLQPGPTAPTEADSEPHGPTVSRSDLSETLPLDEQEISMNFFRAMCHVSTSSPPESQFLCWQCDSRWQHLYQREGDCVWPSPEGEY